jgi:hypothetical protein
LEARGTRSLDRRLIPKICKQVAAFVDGDPQARQQLETLLENHKLTVDLIIAAAFDDHRVATPPRSNDHDSMGETHRRLCRTRPPADNIGKTRRARGCDLGNRARRTSDGAD